MAIELRVISEPEIVENISARQIIDVVEAVFVAYATGKAILPTKYHYNMPLVVLGLVPWCNTSLALKQASLERRLNLMSVKFGARRTIE